VDWGTRVLFWGVKVTWTDFVSFAFVRHFFNQDWFLFQWFAVCVATVGCLCTVGTAVLSWKVAVVLTAVVGESAVVSRWRRGPTHCPAARQIELGEGLYIPLCTLTENIYFPGMILGFCVYCLEIVFLFCAIVDHKLR
jgi:hypothetical protein